MSLFVISAEKAGKERAPPRIYPEKPGSLKNPRVKIPSAPD
jgi:hypothetical protein